ncbi:acetylcholine receptor subunit alpha-1-B-like [Haliotis asinina]|uniref:acetylcholine receptor subunit alpha-1-B-like n=1 Tax=Haliotis asinina TaxID=109174 RepID=UPI003532325B
MQKIPNFVTLMLAGVWVLKYCCCEADPDRRQQQHLKQDLLHNYTSTVSPQGATNQVTVSLSFALIAVLAVEETSQIFRISGAMNLIWTDPWLTWDDSNGIRELRFAPSEIWTPNVIIPNGVGDKISSLSASMPINVQHTGEAMMFIISEFEMICDLDVTWYPYDEQVCHMAVLSMFEFQLQLGDQSRSKIFSAYFTGSSEWNLVNSTIGVKYAGSAPYIDIEFRLQRLSIFYTLSVIFPMCLLSFLNACVFLLPAASGEKVSFLVSIFVSGAVFLNYINDAIPKSGNTSRLTIYLVLLLSQSALALLVTILVMNIHHQQGALVCFFRRKNAVHQSEGPGKDSSIKNEKVAERLDNFFFVLFVSMAALSIMVFYV